MKSLAPASNALLIAIALFCGQQVASAQVTANYNGGAQLGQDFFVSQISADDLVDQSSPYLSSYSTTGAGAYLGYAGAFNDGIFTPGNGSVDAFGNNVSATFNLDVADNPLGFTITKINSFDGYVSQNIGVQCFDLKIQFVGSNDFIDEGTFTNNDGTAFNFYNALSTLTTLTGSNGAPMFTGVSALEFQYIDASTGSGSVAHNVQEIDVFGAPTTAAVPEPSAWAMMLGGVAFLGFCLRRQGARR